MGVYANPLPGASATGRRRRRHDHRRRGGSTRAVTANTYAAPAENATVRVTNSIDETAISKQPHQAGTGHASIAISYSDHEPGSDELTGPYTSVARSHMTDVGDAKFADPVLGDLPTCCRALR